MFGLVLHCSNNEHEYTICTLDAHTCTYTHVFIHIRLLYNNVSTCVYKYIYIYIMLLLLLLLLFLLLLFYLAITSSTRTRRGGSCLRFDYKTFFIYRTCARCAPCVRALCELVVLLLPENVTCVRPRWHETSSEHVLRTRHLTSCQII